MADIIHVNDIGVDFVVTVTENGVAKDISDATTLEIKFRKQNGDLVTKTALFVATGSDGNIHYVSEAGVLDTKGQWELQAHVVGPTYDLHSDIDTFTVADNLV